MLAEATGFTSHRDEDLGGYIVSPDDLGDRLARTPRLDGYVITSTCGELIRPAAFGSPANPMDRSCSAPPGPSSTCCARSPTDAAAATSRSPLPGGGPTPPSPCPPPTTCRTVTSTSPTTCCGPWLDTPPRGPHRWGCCDGRHHLLPSQACDVADAHYRVVTAATPARSPRSPADRRLRDTPRRPLTPSSSPTCSSTPSATTAGQRNPAVRAEPAPRTRPGALPVLFGAGTVARLIDVYDDKWGPAVAVRLHTDSDRPTRSWAGRRHDAALPVRARHNRRRQARTGLVRPRPLPAMTSPGPARTSGWH